MTIKEVAEILDVTVAPVHHLIDEGRLPAENPGMQYVIKRSYLSLVEDRKTDRPPKEKDAKE